MVVDTGPDTPAQKAGARYDDARDQRGYQVHGKVRDHILMRMHRGTARTRRQISERQMRAGMELYARWCRTQTTPEKTGVYVDRTPDPSAAAVMQAQRVFEFRALSQRIPGQHREVVEHVCLHDRSIRDGLARNDRETGMHLALLQVALDILANDLGY